ncbi:Hypothetical predicted protein [Pelobates cultripes]|uniref:Secreted protein n=1 Tax=Pelobates cultripes TaxID=61616 RepID=A0AAD1QXD9_PELCU|nr:Hypothetical predicted protein [Pelobates cultripes]
MNCKSYSVFCLWLPICAWSVRGQKSLVLICTRFLLLLQKELQKRSSRITCSLLDVKNPQIMETSHQ